MSEFDVFDVRKEIEAGIKIDLKLPDGTDSGHWIKVRNFRSDAYRDALRNIQSRIAQQGAPSAEQARKDRYAVMASLIAEWNFKTPLTPESALELVEKAILVREQIDAACINDRDFFGDASKPSSNGQPQK